jgi:cell division protein FtsL
MMLRKLNFVLVGLSLASAFTLYVIKHDTRQLDRRVQADERILDRLENDIAVLKAERAHLARPSRIDKIARTLGLAPISARQYVRADELHNDGTAHEHNADAALPAPAQR